jgi:hypothetical protein
VNTVDANPSPTKLRTFTLTMLGGFLVLGTLLWSLESANIGRWTWTGGPLQVFALACLGAGVAFALTLVMPHRWRRAIYVAWMTGTMFLGMVVATVVLSALFVVVLPFFSLIRFQDPLRLRRRTCASYWLKHSCDDPSLDRLNRPF